LTVVEGVRSEKITLVEDGWLDLFTTNSRFDTEDRLYQNNGDGTFSFANFDHWLFNGNDETQAAGWDDADIDVR